MTQGLLLAMRIFWPVENKPRQSVLTADIIMGSIFCYKSWNDHEKKIVVESTASRVASKFIIWEQKINLFVILISLKYLFQKTSYIQIIIFHLPFGGFPVVCTKLNIKSVQAEPWSKPNGFFWHLRPSAVLFVDVLLWHDGLIFDEKWWLKKGSYESRG